MTLLKLCGTFSLFLLVSLSYANAVPETNWLPIVLDSSSAVVWNLEKLPIDVQEKLNKLVKVGQKGNLQNPLREKILKLFDLKKELLTVDLANGNKLNGSLGAIIYHRDKGDDCLYESSAYLEFKLSSKIPERGEWAVLPSNAKTKPAGRKIKLKITQIYKNNSEVKSRNGMFGSSDLKNEFVLVIDVGSNEYFIASYPGNMDTFWIFQQQKPALSIKEISSFNFPPCGS